LTFDRLILSVGITYVGLQIPEEGLLNFTAWVNRRGMIANFTTTTWLLQQPYFILALSLAYFIYRIDPEKFLPVGLGVMAWGLLSFLGFAGLTLFSGEYAPGLIAGLIYLPLAFWAARLLHRQGKFTPRLALLGSLSGLLILALPIAAYLIVNKAFGI
jgi:uncharacterized membrane protein (UPF0136 family)